MLAVMGLIDATGHVTADAIAFQGWDLLRLSRHDRRRLVGREVAMVFQDALTSLNPSYTVGAQIAEVLKAHLGMSTRAARDRWWSCWSWSRSPTRRTGWTPTRTPALGRHEPARDDRDGDCLQA